MCKSYLRKVSCQYEGINNQMSSQIKLQLLTSALHKSVQYFGITFHEIHLGQNRELSLCVLSHFWPTHMAGWCNTLEVTGQH